MSNPDVVRPRRVPRAVATTGGGMAFTAAVVLGLLAGYGWLYVLRGAGWLRSGPRVGDSLPLLQLAGFDGQPLARVAVAWLLAGVLTGIALICVAPSRRAVLAGALGLVLLLLASQASYALARNLPFGDVMLHRSPGPGPWVQAFLFGLGCALPRRAVARAQGGRIGGLRGTGVFGNARQLRLGGGQDRHATEDDGNRGQVHDDRGSIRA